MMLDNRLTNVDNDWSISMPENVEWREVTMDQLRLLPRYGEELEHFIIHCLWMIDFHIT